MSCRGIASGPLAFFLPSLGGGGAERVMLNLAAGFAGRGFQTDIVLSTAEGPYLAQVPAGVRIIDLRASRVLRAFWPLAGYLRRERPMVLLSALHYANIVAMAAARTSRVKTRTIISIHNTISRETRDTVRTRAIPPLLRGLHKWADAIIAVSGGVADDLTVATGIPRARVDVIYNPVVTSELLAAASELPAHSWFADAGPPVVLGVGRFTPQKNFAALIDAFRLLRRQVDARLVILGDGPERSALEVRVRSHGLENYVALPGFVDNPYSCMARAAVLALSSRWEGLPTVIIESLAVNTPVVSTDCPSGPREILRDGVPGALVPVDDVPALAAAIARALRSARVPTPVNALRPFTPDVVLDQYQRVFDLHA